MSSIKPVLTKKDFVKRFHAGEFGNRTPTWDYCQFVDPRYKLYHLRNRIAGGPTYYNLSLGKLGRMWCEQSDMSNWYAAAMAPTEHTLIQGEVQRTEKGLYLRCSKVKAPMRQALASSQDHVWGLKAMVMLKLFMCGKSYSWLEHLLDIYEDHIIEFSTYGVDFGTVPGMNSLFWEVRKY